MAPSSADIGVGTLMAVVATLGLVFNGCGFVIVVKNSVLATTFGRLCLSHCIANLCACTSFLCWVAPMTISQDHALSTGILGKLFGQADVFFWDVSIYSHVIVSLDRTLSVSIPIKKGLLLKYYRSWFIVAFPVLLAVISVTPYFWYSSCYFVYHPEDWTWLYAHTRCGKGLNEFCFYKNSVLLVIMAVLDMITLYFLRKHHNFLRKNSLTSRNRNEVERNRRKREIRFFIQTVIQGGIFCMENLFKFFFYNSSKLYTFIFITMSWCLCHSVDGLVLCFFQMKTYKMQRRTATVTTTTRRTTTTTSNA